MDNPEMADTSSHSHHTHSHTHSHSHSHNMKTPCCNSCTCWWKLVGTFLVLLLVPVLTNRTASFWVKMAAYHVMMTCALVVSVLALPLGAERWR